MNIQLISKYLQILRKAHGYTQEELAQILNISRQAVSKWETGGTVPETELLLSLSKLYDMTINEILEPNIQPKKILDFEQITDLPESKLKRIMESFEANDIVKASMGASPTVNGLLKKILPDIDFPKMQNVIGNVRIEEVERIHNEIVEKINIDEGM